MIAKIHAKGASFMGLGNYILHDKDRAPTSERVAWTETRNLATRNPHMAVRVMAATAMDADRLKREAGVKATGRKSKKSVMHMTLSWHPDELKELGRDEMLRAAHGAIRALGADDRQALIVAHSDEEHAHVHIALNRVSSDDGRMLSSSKEKLALSRWAQDYEQDRGRILCENRVINNAARDRGEYTRGEPDKPRHIYELEASNDNVPDAEKIKAEQKKLDLALSRKTREQKARHIEQQRKLAADLRERRAEIQAEKADRIKRAVQQVRAEYRQAWTERFHERQAELRDFERREAKLTGRISNAVRTIDFGAVFTAGDRKQALKDAYNVLGSSGARLEALKKAEDRRDHELETRQKADERKAAIEKRIAARAKLSEAGALYTAERATLAYRQGMERAGLAAAWRTRGSQRVQAFERARDVADDREPRGKQTTITPKQIAEDLNRRLRDRQAKSREQDNDRGRGGHSR
ncbi:MAG: relaxase/mobilization nuclease domain-containing protein [Planctomycetota bacterium]